MSHVVYKRVVSHTNECDVDSGWALAGSATCISLKCCYIHTWLMHMWPHMWHATQLNRISNGSFVCDTTHSYGSFIGDMTLYHMAHSYVTWRISFKYFYTNKSMCSRVTRLIHTYGRVYIHEYVWHYYMYDILLFTRLCVWHDWFIHINGPGQVSWVPDD